MDGPLAVQAEIAGSISRREVLCLVCRWCAWAVSDRISSRWASPRRAVFLALLRVPYRGQGVCFGPF